MERAEAEAIYGQGREVVVAVLLRMDEQVRRLGERVARQDERIAELERRLNRNSRNSSNPPSRDPPGTPERKRADPSGRGQGAQPGHPGRGRGLLPLEAVDVVVDHWPPGCGCGRPFAEDEREPICDPARHQVCELPEIAVRVSEHRLHRLRCPDCGASARAELPAAVPAGAFGPRLEAAIATLAVRNRVSRATRSSSARSCSARGSRAGRSTPSWGAPPRRWLSPTRTCSTTSAARRRSTSTRPAGG